MVILSYFNTTDNGGGGAYTRFGQKLRFTLRYFGGVFFFTVLTNKNIKNDNLIMFCLTKISVRFLSVYNIGPIRRKIMKCTCALTHQSVT